MPERSLTTIRLAAVAGVVGISFSAIFVELADVEPAVAAFFRLTYALPALFIIRLAIRRRDQRSLTSRIMAAVSGMFLAIDLTLWHHSIDLIGAGLATVMANTQVVFVGLVAWLVWRERPTTAAFRIIPILLIGVALVTGLGRDDAFGDDPLLGVLFGLGTAVGYAGFLLIFRASNRAFLAPTAGPLLDATAGGAVTALVAGLIEGGFSFNPVWPAHGWLLALALVVQTVAWLLIAGAIPRLPALETSVLLLVQPVGALIWARLIFDESLSAVQNVGVLLVLGGIVALSTVGVTAPEGELTEPAVTATRPAD